MHEDADRRTTMSAARHRQEQRSLARMQFLAVTSLQRPGTRAGDRNRRSESSARLSQHRLLAQRVSSGAKRAASQKPASRHSKQTERIAAARNRVAPSHSEPLAERVPNAIRQINSAAVSARLSRCSRSRQNSECVGGVRSFDSSARPEHLADAQREVAASTSRLACRRRNREMISL